MLGIATPGKQKARNILQTMCSRVIEPPARLPPGNEPVAFYGVVPATRALWDEARTSGRDWLYCDNSYTDVTRGTHFRVTKNRVQHSGVGISDGTRFLALGVKVEPWTNEGTHILVCPQSPEFMQTVIGYRGNWVDDTMTELRNYTGRPLRLRPWSRNKAEMMATLNDDLEDCWAVVTHSSAVAVSALLRGIPAFCTWREAFSICKRSLDQIDAPPRTDGRLELFNVLADNQFTLEELRAGAAGNI